MMSGSLPPPRKNKWMEEYLTNQEILIIGDGDFSFLWSLVKAFKNDSNILR
ncbi:hypothetical protein HanHA300_Chr14g0542291 [Helianthus annuus]|nr:hypothetical protein HanHA300_Chr14g0542291 [Helianthus annuus]KAJ0470725.1 hypothetical protein HanIR_Chr14g0721891 [Helianthus annuus]KAJ0487404.1 hypothetical protein HanHA89_Chr14g0590031 [Helianthus annuus]KAJ0657846.1 hypothetical protein HanLR1_Chr14g0551231 [Helianthus annuus]KAJ0661512.1 hypothetical protein HanOQP8_Chr14g0549341 [Helianthus annuus]